MFIKRTIRFFSKYGGIWAPVHLISWKLFKIKNRLILATKILSIEKNIFLTYGQSRFKNLYEGGLDEFNRIIEGERKILFYNDKDENKRIDIKTQWELKRCHHGPILAIFSSSENNSQFHTLFDKRKLSDFLRNSNAMEVAISTINVITSLRSHQGKHEIEIENNIAEHLRSSLAYIVCHYEKGIRFSANHYFFNLLGVLWICESISGNKFIEIFKRKTYKQLITLLQQITSSDGSLYEGSTHYHKYVTESLLLFLYEFDESIAKNELYLFAKSMVQFIENISFNNEIIGIGDNDSGRLLPLPSYFQYKSSDLSLIYKLSNVLKLNTREKSTVSRKRNDDFGLYLLKNRFWHVAIRLETGKRKFRKTIGAHCHNDQLHLTVFYQNKPLFVDSGVYSYISENENRLNALKTSSHNTLQIDYYEQNQVYNNFEYSKRDAIGRISSFNKSGFVGEHNGYKRLNATHERQVFFENERLVIVDTLKFHKIQNEHKLSIFYHVHPSFQVEVIEQDSLIIKDDKDSYLVSYAGIHSITLTDSIYSKEYGCFEKNLVIQLNGFAGKNDETKKIIIEIEKKKK